MTVPPRVGLFVVAVCLLAYALLAGASISGPRGVGLTYDEPLHAVGAWHVRHHGDFRVNREDPALFLRYVSLWTSPDDVAVAYDAAAWRETRQGTYAPRDYLRRAVYGNGVIPEAVVRNARPGSLLISILLVAASAGVAWATAGKTIGPTAGAVTAALLCLDPLLLGHGVLVKNDVPMALVLLGVAWCAGCVMRPAASLGWVAGLVVLSAAAPLVKFSGVLVAPIVAALVLARALSAQSWTIGPIAMGTRRRRLTAAAAILSACLLTFVAFAWAAYGFRFNAYDGPDRISVSSLLGLTAGFEYRAANPGRSTPPPGTFTDWQPPAPVAAAVWAYRNRLLPEALLTGWIYTYATSTYRPAFLLGDVRGTGWWYFFPLAWLFKTPMATLALTAGATMLTLFRLRRMRAFAWLIVPPGVFLAAAMGMNLNIGLRHVLPLVPFVAIGIGIVAAHAIARWGRPAALLVGLAVALLAAEVLPRHGQYIQFFNLAAGGSRGGLRLLSDSNLDWGQDLPRLLKWQNQNPGRRLYLYRFGHFADLPRLGLTSINLSSGDPGDGPGVLAISATLLQGLYISDPNTLAFLSELRQQPPAATLGDTIYLFDVPSRPPLPPR